MRYISAFDYYEGIYWFCANTFANKMLQYFTGTSESHIGYFQLWRHILRHLRHLLALCWKSHKPPFRLAQLKWFLKNNIEIATYICTWSRFSHVYYDLPFHVEHSLIDILAYDETLHSSSPDKNIIRDKLTSDLTKLRQWCVEKGMKITQKKMIRSMLIGTNQKLTKLPAVNETSLGLYDKNSLQ